MKKTIDLPLYVNVEIKKNKDKNNYYEAVIYIHTILLEETKSFPYDFLEYDYKGTNIIYFFNEINQQQIERKKIYQKLKEKRLIKPHNEITKEEGVFMINDIESWNLFICKNDINKTKVTRCAL